MRKHTLAVPWDRGRPGSGTLDIFARELSVDETLPPLLYLQGGPGNAAPRPTEVSGWLAAALRHYRVFLLDQRGTGRSGRIDRRGDGELIDARHLSLLRADHIAADAEDLRRHLGLPFWDVLGQSFGGFCITTYISMFPESIRYAYFTGGLPSISGPADDVYRATYGKLAERSRLFYAAVPFAERRIREICHHLDNSDERLPTGERLSARRFRTIGVELGRGGGFFALAGLLEEPFHDVRGEKRLRGDVLADFSGRLSFERAPLYAAVHETIYGGTAPGPTAWAAQRVRQELDGFQEDLDPARDGRFYLTGEHVYPWLFEEDPALREFARAAGELAHKDDWNRLYDAEALAAAPAVAAAAVYRDDIFVPLEQSLATAAHFRDLRTWVTAEHQHDGLRRDGEAIFDRLLHMVRA